MQSHSSTDYLLEGSLCWLLAFGQIPPCPQCFLALLPFLACTSIYAARYQVASPSNHALKKLWFTNSCLVPWESCLHPQMARMVSKIPKGLPFFPCPPQDKNLKRIRPHLLSRSCSHRVPEFLELLGREKGNLGFSSKIRSSYHRISGNSLDY